jgi:hypothetical protein
MKDTGSQLTIEKAMENLGINERKSDVNEAMIKKHYRMMALKYHPDKNREIGSHSYFLTVQSSYEFLMKNYVFERDFEDKEEDDNNDNTEEDEENENENSEYFMNFFSNLRDPESSSVGYTQLLFSFIKNVLSKDTTADPLLQVRNKLIQAVFEKISMLCEERSLVLLEKLDKQVLIKIIEIIQMYNDVLHISPFFIEKIENILETKQKENECIILNPFLEDLFENYLYRLTKNGVVHIIPLWHHELVYDNAGRELFVKCIPVLPENIWIDENNHIHTELVYVIKDLWEREKVDFIMAGRIFSFPCSSIRLLPKQEIVLKNCGISVINSENVYDISKKSNVIVHLHLGLQF